MTSKTLSSDAAVLLPCPFCGSAPEIRPERPDIEGDAWTSISCPTMDCAANGGVTEYADQGHFEMAAKLWNTRALVPIPQVSEEVVEREDNDMMPPLWALGHMPTDWGPVPGVPVLAWGYLLKHGYIERNGHAGAHFGQVRITEKGWAILAVRTPGPAALAVTTPTAQERVDYLASEAVERAAQALAAEDGGPGNPLGYFAQGTPMREAVWEDFLPEQHEAWRRMARAAMATISPPPSATFSAGVIEAAGRIFDIFGNSTEWRKRADLSDIYESADWAQALAYAEAALSALATLSPSPGAGVESFQARVAPWMQACFGPKISADERERGDRLLEEVLETLQSRDYDFTRIPVLVDYVANRPKGETSQEVGGVMVTLAALCLAVGADMHEAGETELARIWTKVDQIRAKQAAKPDMSGPLPAPPSTQPKAEGK